MKWFSRKLISTLVFGGVTVANSVFNLGIEQDTIQTIGYAVMTYIGGQSLVDFKEKGKK